MTGISRFSLKRTLMLLVCLFTFILVGYTAVVKKKIRDNHNNKQIRQNENLNVPKKIKHGNHNQLKESECDEKEKIFVSMNSDETEMFFLDLDTYFPYNNFTIIDVILIEDDTTSQIACKQNDSNKQGENICIQNPSQKVVFQPQNPTIVEEIIYINVTSDSDKTQVKEEQECPKNGINMIASKAPEDQPVHIFLSQDDQNQYSLYVIIFDDTQHPVSKIANYSKNLNSYVEADETLVCMDIEVYDSGNKDNSFSDQSILKDDPEDDTDCLVYIDCNIIKQGQEDQQNFAMIFVPLKKDENDIIKTIGDITIKRYQIKDQQASDYFYNCPRRVIDNYSSMLIMYCPIDQTNKSPKIDSNILFFKHLDKGINFPNPDEIIFIDQSHLQKSNCQEDGKSIQINSLVTNPLYQPPPNPIFSDEWEFSLLLNDRICKCRLLPNEQSIGCSSIQLSNSIYHKMVYIQEDSVLTLFVGSDSGIDEIQVGESMSEDGQNLIVGSLEIEEKDLILTKITVNSEYIMAQMKNTTYTGNGNIDVVVKIYSRTNENSFLHYYQTLESPMELYQNDNFYDMGNYIMVYSPLLCILQVTRVTQKPLVISTLKSKGEKLQKIQTQTYKIIGNYSVLNQFFEFETRQNDGQCLTLQLVPYSQSVLNPQYFDSQDTTWQQQMINLPIKKYVTGSLLYFTYEPNVQNDKFKSLIDYNQTIIVQQNFFANKTIFYLELNDTNKIYNPPNYRAVISDINTPCIIEQYYCEIINKGGQYYTGNECNKTTHEDLTRFLKTGETCKLDTFSEGQDLVFIGDKSQRLGFVCSSLQNKLSQQDDYTCYRVDGDFADSEILIDDTGKYQGYNQIDFYSYAGINILVTVTEDLKKLVLYLVIEKDKDSSTFAGYCSEIFLIVDQTKLSSLSGDGKILQMDSYFLEEDFIFIMTSDLKVYVLTRIQQLYLQKASLKCSLNNKKNQSQNKQRYNIDDIPNTDRLVHVSAMIDLKQSQSSLQLNCQNTLSYQIFALFGVDPNTISLVALCYNSNYYLMQEFVFQNPFTYNMTRVFPFFDYQVDSNAPHFTDRNIIYISTHLQLRSGTMKAYLMYSIYGFTPNSAVFEITTCYPTQDPNSFVIIDCIDSKQLLKENLIPNQIPFSYFQYPELYGKNYQPSIIGIPFNTIRQKTITLALFSFNNYTIINYLNYSPRLYANANLGTDVLASIYLNMIVSKINLRDIHFNQYTINFDLTDSEIQILGDEDKNIALKNSNLEQDVFCLNYQFPITQVRGPIESYEIQMYKNGAVVSVNDQVSDYNSFFGDYLLLQKYFYSYLETYFTYGEVQDILSFSSYQFSPNPQQLQEESCDDCSNLISVLSNKYLILIERDQFDSTTNTITPVTKIIYKIDIPTLDKQTSSDKDGACRMTLNNNSQILVYCVSNKKSTIFKLYQVSYKKNDPGSTTVTSRAISSTGGYIGYVDQIIPFDYGNQVYLVIKTHYILNQQMSVFKIAQVICSSDTQNSKQELNSNDCSLQVNQTFPTNKFQLSETYIVDYEVQLLTNNSDLSNQEVIGLFLSNTTINIFQFKYIEDTFVVTNNATINQTEILDVSQTEYYFENIFIKMLNVISSDNFSFLLGTTLDIYELKYQSGVASLIYTYGKYYQCEHTPGIKPVIFNLNGQPFNRKTNFIIRDDQQADDDPNFSINSVLSSCSRTPSSQKPVFDPDPSIFSKESQSNFYIQYFIKNKSDQSWPVRILTYPYSSKNNKAYVFEGFSNNAGESRIIVSNFSYFLVEHQVQYNLNLNLTLSKDSADTLSVFLVNGFTQKQMNFTVSYDDVIKKEKNQIWFIILIVVISVIAIIALIFIVLWIKKQRNDKNEKKKERMISSGITDISDHKSENMMNENPRQLPAPSKLFSGTNQYQAIQQNQEEIKSSRQSQMFQLVEQKKSMKYNRLSMQVDHLLRSVSMMQRRNAGDTNNTEIINEQEEQ